MKAFWLRLILLCSTSIAFCTYASGFPAVVFKDAPPPDKVIPRISVWQGSTAPTTIEALLHFQSDQDWFTLPYHQRSIGYREKSTWFRIDIDNQRTMSLTRLIAIKSTQINRLEYYLVHNNSVIKRLTTGNHYPFAQRTIDHPEFLIPIDIPAQTRVALIFKEQSNIATMLPIEIWQEQAYFADDRRNRYWQWATFGIILFAGLFNFVIFMTLRESAYLYCALFNFSALFIQQSIHGVSFELVWPNTPRLNDIIILIIPIMAASISEFSLRFLQLSGLPKMICRALVFASAFLILCLPLISSITAHAVGGLLTVVTISTLFIIGCTYWWQRQSGAAFYSVAIAASLIGGLIVWARTQGWLPMNELTTSAFQLGTTIEVIVLSIAIAMRTYQEKQIRISAQQEAANQLDLRQQAENQLLQKASLNSVTGLPNRVPLLKHMTDLMEPSQRHSLALWCIELRNLREIEVSLGSDRVATLLTLYASKLQAFLTENTNRDFEITLFSLENDTLSFCSNAEQSYELRQKLEARIRQPDELDGLSLHLSQTIGVAYFPKHADNAEELLTRALLALNSASSIHRIVAYSKASETLGRERVQQLLELEPALSNGEMRIHLQPKIDLTDLHITGFEALIRWFHPEHGIVPPNRFIPLAERTGLINVITLWVLDKSIETLAVLSNTGHSDISISVNISAHDLSLPGFEKHVIERLRGANVEPAMLCLELTETAALQDLETSKSKLQRLSQQGIRLSMDDFGTGYSSLALLQELPLNELKIDRSLIANAHQSEEQKRILEIALDIGHTLKLECVCEGIEETETLTLLRQLDCRWGQGFLFSGAMPVETALNMLDSNPFYLLKSQLMN